MIVLMWKIHLIYICIYNEFMKISKYTLVFDCTYLSGVGLENLRNDRDPYLEYVAIVLTSIKHALDWPP